MSNINHQKYSFPKSPRFQNGKKQFKDVFYEIPQIKSTRASSLGYGNKISIEGNIKSITPGPGTYQYTKTLMKTGLSIGLGREDVKANQYIPKSQFTIGPGQFGVQSTNNKKSFSFGLKLQIQNNKYKNVPGPGHYPVFSSINSLGIYTSSKIENSHCPIFNPPSSVRFKQDKNQTPGPGQYEMKIEQQKGKYLLSNIRSTDGPTIGKKQREFFNTKNQVPGPGTYQIKNLF